MWGFTLRTPAERVKREFRLEEEPSIEARFNIAPTQEIFAVKQSPDGSEAVMLKLWLATDNGEQAKKHALAAYKSAWADGEPYVYS